jgi:hypothetical protein
MTAFKKSSSTLKFPFIALIRLIMSDLDTWLGETYQAVRASGYLGIRVSGKQGVSIGILGYQDNLISCSYGVLHPDILMPTAWYPADLITYYTNG